MADLTFTLDSALDEALSELAASTGLSRDQLASEALSAFVAQAKADQAAIRRGLEDIASGRVVSHAEAMKRLKNAAGIV